MNTCEESRNPVANVITGHTEFNLENMSLPGTCGRLISLALCMLAKICVSQPWWAQDYWNCSFWCSQHCNSDAFQCQRVVYINGTKTQNAGSLLKMCTKKMLLVSTIRCSRQGGCASKRRSQQTHSLTFHLYDHPKMTNCMISKQSCYVWLNNLLFSFVSI